VRVGSLVRVLAGQVKFRHDPPDHVLVAENAPVSQQRESLGLEVVHDATARELFVFRFTGNLAVEPPLFPNVDVAPRMGQVISIGLSFAEANAPSDRIPESGSDPFDNQRLFKFAHRPNDLKHQPPGGRA
jgi:hypothetical protein